MEIDVKEMVKKIRLMPGYVLIKYIDLPERYKNLIYYSPLHIDKRKASRKVRSWKGVVIKYSPIRTADGKIIPVGFKEGDIVFFDEKMGIRYYDGNEMYMINKISDIFAVFEDCSIEEAQHIILDVWTIR